MDHQSENIMSNKSNVKNYNTGFREQLLGELVSSRFNSIENNENPELTQFSETAESSQQISKKNGAVFVIAHYFLSGLRVLVHRLRSLAGIIYRDIKAVLRPAKRFYVAQTQSLKYKYLPNVYFKNDVENYSDVSYLYSYLKNKSSRDLLVKLFAYRILGHRKIKLPRNTEEYWAGIDSAANLKTSKEPIKIDFMNATLANYDLKPIGFDLNTYASPIGLACAFIQKQYEYNEDGVICKAETGDVAIDAGGCWGETTMYFAHEVGASGKVYTFEFIPNNLAVMKKNIECNPHLASRVELVEAPIWSFSGKKLYYLDWGPGSRVFDSPERADLTYGECNTLSIDDLVSQRNIPRVDFIKMDIEGAELPALKGAEKTITRFRPKLAISIYHQVSDFTTIPKYLNSLDLDYSFYLDHHTIHLNETVLFAVPNKPN